MSLMMDQQAFTLAEQEQSRRQPRRPVRVLRLPHQNDVELQPVRARGQETGAGGQRRDFLTADPRLLFADSSITSARRPGPCSPGRTTRSATARRPRRRRGRPQCRAG